MSDKDSEVLARSVLDQATTAAEDAERLWPHNKAMWSDLKVEARLLDCAIGPDSDSAWGALVRPDQVTLVWPVNGAAVQVQRGEDVAMFAAHSYPLALGQTSTCDRCAEDKPPYGALLFAHGAKIIGLVFCHGCAEMFNLAWLDDNLKPVWVYNPNNTQPQGV
ncbi:hypothetical protein [Terrabacter sp. Root181]|uniref:hypothetical protein n=1 Tax=Terrabacter sp. Root181 TaxID=1736484 RepID=UPI0012FAFD3A|nr:hypothetical protein [Terrabacter sp. Root181]